MSNFRKLEDNEVMEHLNQFIEDRVFEALLTKPDISDITLSEPEEIDVEDLPDYIKFGMGGDNE